jgi:hypothetical protein
MFLPAQQSMAAELASLGLTGADAALALRTLQVHVISSVLMERAAARNASHGRVDVSLWPAEGSDPELVAALADPADYETVFEFGLEALLVGLSSD